MRRAPLLAAVVACVAVADPKTEVSMSESWAVEARVSSNPHSHPLASGQGDVVYLDTVSEGQVVGYLKGARPPQGAWVRATGTVLRFEATPPRPGSTKSFPVRQLRITALERLAGADRVEALVEELGRDEVPLERKRQAKADLYQAGLDAFPVLISHLSDGRIYERGRDVQNYYGRPANQPMPPPLRADAKVGDECRELLHRLLIPVGYQSPKQRVFKPRGELFLVEDWPGWWLRHRSQSLGQIHDQLKPAVDRYYETGGDSQPAP